MQKQIKVVSFDIGGTLINYKTGKSITTKIAEIMNMDERIVKFYIRKHFNTKKGDIQEFCEELGFNQPNLVAEIIRCYENNCTLYEETYKTLSLLKEKGLELVSISNASSFNKYKLDSYGIGVFFDLELYTYDFGCMKLDKTMFNYVQDKLGVGSDEIIHVGDSITDIKAAKNVKWKSALIERSSDFVIDYRPEDKPDYIIHSLDEIVNIIT